MILFDKKQNCCGCTACLSVCPNKAIRMELDEEGFLYPSTDVLLCIECGLCKAVCPLQNEINDQDRFVKPLIYALKHKSESVRMTSASGGAYTAISDYALNKSCALYGVEFSKNFTVQHNRTTTEAGRNKFRGSKYVQSNLDGIFKQIHEDLVNGRAVFFTGTPCQVAGLRKYLDVSRIKTDKLTLNDIICHGTSSPILWKQYIKFIQKKSRIKSFTFRAKEKGWHGCNVKVEFDNGKSKINTSKIMIYANIFSSDLALRPSCYCCKFSKLHRPSDITIGDFWGVEKSLPELDDDKGVSLVFVNTPKGQVIFDKVKDKIHFEQSNTKDCMQHNLQQPTKIPKNRECFWDDYQKLGFKYIAKKYVGYSFKDRLKIYGISVVRKIGLLEFIKKVIRKRNE